MAKYLGTSGQLLKLGVGDTFFYSDILNIILFFFLPRILNTRSIVGIVLFYHYWKSRSTARLQCKVKQPNNLVHRISVLISHNYCCLFAWLLELIQPPFITP